MKKSILTLAIALTTALAISYAAFAANKSNDAVTVCAKSKWCAQDIVIHSSKSGSLGNGK